jgi:hypothetical protein
MPWRFLADCFVSLLTLAALAAIVYGIHLIYPPLAWVGGGVALLFITSGINSHLRRGGRS